MANEPGAFSSRQISDLPARNTATPGTGSASFENPNASA
jgi:hypothetical protein